MFALSIANLVIVSLLFAGSAYSVWLYRTTNKQMANMRDEAHLNIEATRRAGEFLTNQIHQGLYRVTDIETLLSDIEVLRIRFRNEDAKNPAGENR